MNGEIGEQGNGGAPAGDPARQQLFFSYSRTDQKAALPMIRALERQGYQVWWDGLLEGGDNFLPTTEAALQKADAVVVLWSRTSIDSHWVRDEATVGRDRRRLVPLSIDGSMPPLGFRQFQVIDVSKWSGKSDPAGIMRRIVSAIAMVSGGGAPAGGQTANSPGRQPAGAVSLDRRTLLMGAGVLAAAGGGAVAWRLLQPAVPGAAAQSIAVLPFRNLSGRADQDYFAEGVGEELRTTLSLNRQLLVSGAASVGGFRGGDTDARQIARTLGVANLLSGSVQPAAGRVRITARLVDGNTGIDRWSQSFDRTMADVLAVQAEIATTVADALVSTLAKDASWSAQRPGSTRNAAAFDAYAKGQALYLVGASSKSDAQALAAYDKAIALDPGYGAAHAARGRTLAAIANQEASIARATALRQEAQAGARKAIALAPDMPEGHAALGFALMSQLDLGAAKPAYQRSFELGLGNASILSAYAEFSANMGEFKQADAAIQRAKRLDPLNPGLFRNAGMVAFAAKDYAAAITDLETALSLNPRLGIAHRVLGDMALIKGDLAEARRQFTAEPSRLSKLRGLAIVDAKLSGQAAGDQQMARLVTEFGDGGLYQQAEVLAQWGRTEAALNTLERALVLRDSGMVLVLFDPLLDPLRSQPRFKAILARLGLEKPAANG
ncbi:TIR domain-containing protein [Sandarakinorhabdus sp.]|uniref:TIR domain-containing protein n=1 Tax=Sandarakinorhabdus sp. TaxID=1916663 RepID=UPI00286E0C88|nr:TIR domain-containing protein [Sandarakinorhabdus sp.]